MELSLFQALATTGATTEEVVQVDLGRILPFEEEEIRWTLLDQGEGIRKDNEGTHAFTWAEFELHWRDVYLGTVLGTEDPTKASGIRWEPRRRDGDDTDG